MIVHISASTEDIGETICSLTFAKRVRAVDSSRELSEVVSCINESISYFDSRNESRN